MKYKEIVYASRVRRPESCLVGSGSRVDVLPALGSCVDVLPVLGSCVDVLPVLVSCAMVAKCSQNAAKMHAKCLEKQAYTQNWPPLSSEKQKWKIMRPSCATCLDQQAKCKEKVHPNMPHQSQHTPNWPPLSSEKQKWEKHGKY